MRFIHCADIHADSKMGTHFSGQQSEIRRNDIVQTFADMADYAVKNQVRAVIIAGDLFDTKTSQQKNIKKRIDFIIRSNPQIDFLYLRGNHDEDSSLTEKDPPANLKTFTKDSWTKYTYENTEIYGRELSQTISTGIYSELRCDPDKINIVTLHGQVAGYTTKPDAPDISLPKLTDKNIDYLALGHIHTYRHEKLDSRGQWCYSGCLEGRGFDECGQKGFVLLEVNQTGIEHKFIPFARRTVHEINIPLKPVMDYNEILSAIVSNTSQISKEDIVQINLTGEIAEDTLIEPEYYSSTLQNNFFLIRIKDKTKTKIDYTAYENDISLKGEFIRLVQSQTDLSEEMKSKIIVTGINALAGRLC